MSEVLRRYYLQTLGIECYEPRWVLPNAAASVLYADDAAVALPNGTGDDVESIAPCAESTTNSALANEATVTRGNLESNSSLGTSNNSLSHSNKALNQPSNTLVESVAAQLQNSATASPTYSTQQDRMAAIAAKSRPGKQLQFSLSVWRISPQLLVIDSRKLALALPTDQLLANIVQALGYPANLPRAETIRWPFAERNSAAHFSGEGSDQAQETAARDMVQAFVSGQFEKSPFEFLLVMGATAAKFVLDTKLWPASDDPRELLGKSMAQEGYQAIVVPSLAVMLQNPATKAITWQAVQPLRLTQ